MYYIIRGICRDLDGYMSSTFKSSKIQNIETGWEVEAEGGVQCEITMFATYNPASIDNGITKMVYTKKQRK